MSPTEQAGRRRLDRGYCVLASTESSRFSGGLSLYSFPPPAHHSRYRRGDRRRENRNGKGESPAPSALSSNAPHKQVRRRGRSNRDRKRLTSTRLTMLPRPSRRGRQVGGSSELVFCVLPGLREPHTWQRRVWRPRAEVVRGRETHAQPERSWYLEGSLRKLRLRP
jgi:hypothetical protein